jgi:hypothetical protein
MPKAQYPDARLVKKEGYGRTRRIPAGEVVEIPRSMRSIRRKRSTRDLKQALKEVRL